MILWTIQSMQVYEEIMRKSYYHCDFRLSLMNEYDVPYDWLVKQMNKRIGEAPKGVTYPVWAWHTWESARKKLDLRKFRFGCGAKGNKYVCLEIEIEDTKVLLSDFDAWSIILLDSLLSDTEKEDEELYNYYNSLSEQEKIKFKETNWERVFDVEPFHNEWIRRGDSIQATFWELRREQIRDVRFFTGA